MPRTFWAETRDLALRSDHVGKHEFSASANGLSSHCGLPNIAWSFEKFYHVLWAANKRLETSKFKFRFPRARNLEIIWLVLGCIEAKFCK